MNARTAERNEAIERLRTWIRPGDTLYTILRHVSRSGMQRRVSVKHVSCKDGEAVTLHIDYPVAQAIGMQLAPRDGGIIIGGCGTDLGFEIVYQLGRALWPDGFGCIGEKCRSNDHSNGDRDYTPHGACTSGCGCSKKTRYHEGGCTPFDHWHKDSGYALTQRWL